METEINETVCGDNATLNVIKNNNTASHKENAKVIFNFLMEDVSNGTYHELATLILMEVKGIVEVES